MRSLKSHLAVAAVVAAGLVASTSAAHAATTPKAWDSDDCRSSVAMAEKAQKALDDAMSDWKKQTDMGGHPGTAEMENIKSLEKDRNDRSERADHDCHRGEHRHPVGPIHTGVGSTSQGSDGTEVTAGLGLLGAVGAGAVVMLRRRKADSAV